MSHKEAAHNPQLGKVIEGDANRDAVHVAVAPVEAATDLWPGQWVRLNGDGHAYDAGREKAIGVVDPFLQNGLEKGQRFWLFLLPGTITSIRHEWEHPAFKDVVVRPAVVEDSTWACQVLQDTADACGLSYERLLDAARDYAESGDYTMDNSEKWKNADFGDDFWKAFSEVTGMETASRGAPFTCSC